MADPGVEFFFSFPDEETARTAASTLTDKGYRVQTTPPDALSKDCTLSALGEPDTDDVSTADDAMLDWAHSLGGDCDGHEIRIGD